MYCPQCAQLQNSSNLKYCSKCGFLLTGIAQVLANGGIIPHVSGGAMKKVDSARRRGVKQGVFIMLLMLLITPLLVVLHERLGLPDVLILISAILLLFGGFLRMIYAIMFQDETPVNEARALQPTFQNEFGALNSPPNQGALPPQSANFTPLNQAYAAPNQNNLYSRDTGESMMPPPSITENTTKLLEDCDR